MTDPPQFSVVIPVYNGARYIARSVASAVGQTGVRHEVIVVDDGSTDGSGDLAAAVDPTVRVIRHEPNRGLPAARNTGIRAAQGTWVAFLDSDDRWAADKLAAQAALFAAAPELETVFCDFAGIDLEGNPSGWQGGLVGHLPQFGLDLVSVGGEGYRLGGQVAHALIRHSSFMHPSTVVVRRGLFAGAGLFDEGMKYVEDLDMWLRLAASGPVGLVGRVLATVEYRPTSHGRQRVNMDEHIVRLYSALPERFPDLPPDLRAHVGRVVESTHLGLGWQYRTAGDVRAARGHYRAALRHKVRLRTLAALLRTYLPAALR